MFRGQEWEKGHQSAMNEHPGGHFIMFYLSDGHPRMHFSNMGASGGSTNVCIYVTPHRNTPTQHNRV